VFHGDRTVSNGQDQAPNTPAPNTVAPNTRGAEHPWRGTPVALNAVVTANDWNITPTLESCC
jgi:hypothetical protein